MATTEELDKRYEPKEIEGRLYEFWEKGEFFTPLLDAERPKF
jgi:valyl-tRNA synthetase